MQRGRRIENRVRPSMRATVMVPPCAISASEAAFLITIHCSSSAPNLPGAMNVKYGAGPSGYTCVNRQLMKPPPQASFIARRTSLITPLCSRSKVSQVHAVSKVSTMTPMLAITFSKYGASMNAPRHAAFAGHWHCSITPRHGTAPRARIVCDAPDTWHKCFNAMNVNWSPRFKPIPTPASGLVSPAPIRYPYPFFPQHCLYFLPDPHGHGSLRPTLGPTRTGCGLPALEPG